MPKLPSYTIPEALLRDLAPPPEEAATAATARTADDIFEARAVPSIAASEDAYHGRVREVYAKVAESIGAPRRSYWQMVHEMAEDGQGLRSISKTKGPAKTRTRPSRWDVPPGARPEKRGKVRDTDATPGGFEGVTAAVIKELTTMDSQKVGAPVADEAQAPIKAMPVAIKPSRWDQQRPVVVGPNEKKPLVLPASSGGGPLTTPSEQRLAQLNAPLTDAQLDALLPGEREGFTTTKYARVTKEDAAPAPLPFTVPQTTAAPGRTESLTSATALIDLGGGLPEIRPEDRPYFGPLFEDPRDDSQVSAEVVRERRVLRLLLKVKNGLPPQRKQGLRQLSDHARELGPAVLFEKTLPLLMSPTLLGQERHLLIKVIDRVMYRLQELVRPYVREVLAVIQPLLIDSDHTARVEGREVISNLAKAAGLPTMIREMRPGLDCESEFMRNTTARAFAVVAAALGPMNVLLFLRAVCSSRKSWQARHTGTKIVQQMAILLGCGILPYVGSLVETVANGLAETENRSVRIQTALAIAALAEAAAPYGIERFGPILRSLVAALKSTHGKVLAAHVKATGCLIPLMEPAHAAAYAREVAPVVVRELGSPDDDVKRIALKVVRQIVSADLSPSPLDGVIPAIFGHTWSIRVALDPRLSREVVETVIAVVSQVGLGDGPASPISHFIDALHSDSGPFRRLSAETIHRITELSSHDAFGAAPPEAIDRLIDALTYAFQRQHDAAPEDTDPTILGALSDVIVALDTERAAKHIRGLRSTIAQRLTHRTPAVRQLTCEFVARIAPAMRVAGLDPMLAQLGAILYENLGEEYPEVLASILAALIAVVNVIGVDNMSPPINELLPRLTPILKNRKERVQENCIDLVGRIADRGRDYVHPREWIRICFELLEMLKAHKKGIRRAAVATFGYIAAAVGPAEVLVTLLSNLRVQERQNRVCTTVAIAIVAETCQPYTVLPALMNEYRVQELNVQNGVLKALSFLFEYISEMGKDYIYAVAPLLEDALIDRDTVHRQTACTAIKHMALGVVGLGAEDALHHLLNYVWPNIFETSPHVINAVLDAIDGLRVALGAPILLQYLLQGLFHSCKRVRQVYWRIYNNTYVGAAEALVAAYPRLPVDPAHPLWYARPELDLMI